MICLNSLIEPTTRASTTFLQVGASTPVVSSCDVVRMTGVLVSTSWNLAQVAAADVALVGGDAAHVVGILRHKVGVEVDQRLPHFDGVFLIDAKDDGLGEAVGLLEEVRQVAGDGLRAGAQGDDALEILGLVFIVGDRAAVAVELVLARPPAGGVPLGDDAMHAVGREKAVVDALAQAVFVDRVAEIDVGVAVVLAQRRRRHAELVGGLEILEDLAP